MTDRYAKSGGLLDEQQSKELLKLAAEEDPRVPMRYSANEHWGDKSRLVVPRRWRLHQESVNHFAWDGAERRTESEYQALIAYTRRRLALPHRSPTRPPMTTIVRMSAQDHWEGKSRVTCMTEFEPDPELRAKYEQRAQLTYSDACEYFGWDGTERMTLEEWRALLAYTRWRRIRRSIAQGRL